MSDRHWDGPVTLAVAGFVAFSFFMAGLDVGYEHQSAQQPTEQQAESADQIQTACAGQAPLEFKRCAANEVESHRQAEHDAEDLIAQQQSALWAMRSGFIALGGLAVTVLGIGFVWVGLRLNREAVGAATEATEAAVRSADAAEKAYVTENRPWLKIQLVPQSDLTFGRNGADMHVGISYKNIGNGLATSITVECAEVDFGDKSLVEAVKSWAAQKRAVYASRKSDEWGQSVFPTENGGDVVNGHFRQETVAGKLLGDGLRYFDAMIAISVCYRSPLSEAVFQTTMAVMVVQGGEKLARLIPLVGDLKRDGIAKEKIAFSVYPGLTSAI